MKEWLKGFWKEWGLSGEEIGMFAGGLGVVGSIIALYIVLSLI